MSENGTDNKTNTTHNKIIDSRRLLVPQKHKKYQKKTNCFKCNSNKISTNTFWKELLCEKRNTSLTIEEKKNQLPKIL